MFLAQLLCFFLYIARMGVGFVSTGTQARASLACTKAVTFSCCTRQDAAPERTETLVLSNIGHDGHGDHAMGGHSRWDAFRGRSRAASSRKKDCADTGSIREL